MPFYLDLESRQDFAGYGSDLHIWPSQKILKWKPSKKLGLEQLVQDNDLAGFLANLKSTMRLLLNFNSNSWFMCSRKILFVLFLTLPMISKWIEGLSENKGSLQDADKGKQTAMMDRMDAVSAETCPHF